MIKNGLKKYRLHFNITYLSLEKLTGISRYRYIKLEDIEDIDELKKNITLNEIENLTRIFGISIHELIHCENI